MFRVGCGLVVRNQTIQGKLAGCGEVDADKESQAAAASATDSRRIINVETTRLAPQRFHDMWATGEGKGIYWKDWP